MYQSKWGYYADFMVYPIAVLALSWASFRGPHSTFFTVFLFCCLAGLAVWTLIEYVMHRFVFHAVPLLAQMHQRHHANPCAFVGTPSWLSLSAFLLGVFVPIWAVAGLEIASGVVSGLMLGFTWYVAEHDAIHRWPLDRGSILYKAKLRHACHHTAREEGNFGVTTGFWDRVLGTAIDHGSRRQILPTAACRSRTIKGSSKHTCGGHPATCRSPGGSIRRGLARRSLKRLFGPS